MEPPEFDVEGELKPEILERLLAEVSLSNRHDRIEVRWFDLAGAVGGMAVRGDCEIGVGFHGDLHVFEPEFVNEKFKDGYRWKIVANRRPSIASRFVTLAHELAHVYCGHLGGSFDGYSWLDRRALGMEIAEYEAAIISHHVAALAGLKSNAEMEAMSAFQRARSEGQQVDKLSSATCRQAFRRIAIEAGIGRRPI